MNKKEILSKCRDILYRNSQLGKPIDKDEFNFMISIFPLHKNWKEKCNGKNVRFIIVRKNPVYHNKNFALVLEDNSIVDISFIECINRKGLKDDIISACTSIIKDIQTDKKIPIDTIVKDWIKTFANEEISIGIYLTEVAGSMCFNNQYLINNFRAFYTNYK